MEDVLEVYQRPFDPTNPVICMDEQPIQLHAEVREPMPAQPGRPERRDYEYRRNGVACGFMFTEPLGQWRRITIAETRTKKDWARQLQHLLDVDYPDVEKVRIQNIEVEALRRETATWNRTRNQAQKGVDWQFTTSEARRKLKRLYPMILEN